MMRIIYTGFVLLLLGFLFLRKEDNIRPVEKPDFLCTDEIALAHQTNIDIEIFSRHKPDSFQLKTLKQDYSNIWAHLNHLYAVNDVESGKEYYTEDWFRQLCSHYSGIVPTNVQRHDEQHVLQIQNWSDDGLVCTAIDSNVVLHYRYPDRSSRKTVARLAVVLLLQGDHWRIDAMRVISELPL